VKTNTLTGTACFIYLIVSSALGDDHLTKLPLSHLSAQLLTSASLKRRGKMMKTNDPIIEQAGNIIDR
jgi:hypothetical protein